MSEESMGALSAEANKHGLKAVGDEDLMPAVKFAKNLNETARRLGEIVARLDLFELNGDLVYFDFKGDKKPMDAHTFRTWISNYVCIFERRDKDSDKPIWYTLQVTDAESILRSASFLQGVRELRAMHKVRLPVMRSDEKKTVELLPKGYDEETGIYTVDELDYDKEMDVSVAKGNVNRTYGGFPTAEERSMAVQVGGCLSLFTKAMLPEGVLRPGFLWMANKAGSGKSVCAKSILYPTLGTAAAAKMKKGEELDKELEAFSRSAVPYIFLDNVYGGIQSASIDALLTTTESMGRAMGGHSVFVAKNSALLLVTGNELKLNPDSARRFLIVDLFEAGDPETRVVEEPLDDELMRSEEWRSMMLASCWALVRNWDDLGRPMESKSLPTFERFCKLIGGIVMAAGWPDPIVPSSAMEFAAPDKAELKILLRAVAEEMGDEETKEFTAGDLARIARDLDIFGEKVGTQVDAIAAIVKREGLKGQERACAEDDGTLDKKQQSAWGIYLKPQVGHEWEHGAHRYQLGGRSQKRRSSFTVSRLA